MKKLLFTILAVLALTACDTKTPEQKAQESFEKEMSEMENSERNHKFYIDSLVNVATGLEGVENTAKRLDALEKLRKEYPQLSEKWDRCEEAINNMELY